MIAVDSYTTTDPLYISLFATKAASK